MVQGISVCQIQILEPFATAHMACTLLPLKTGLLRLPELHLWSRREDKLLDTLTSVDVFVQGMPAANDRDEESHGFNHLAG